METGDRIAAELLTAHAVVKRYGDVAAVQDVSFALAPGQIKAVLGPNGAGKSSLFRMLIGYSAPDAGQVTYLDRQGRAQSAICAEELGYLPEERGLYQDVTVHEVLVYLAQLHGMERRAATRSLRTLLSTLGLQDHEYKRVRELSKGNQQKVQLAACLVHAPRVLVLDEPFAGLDPRNQEHLVALLRAQRDSGTAILLSAHHLPLLERLVDEALIMDKGRIIRRVPGVAVQAPRDDQFVLEHARQAPLLERLGREPWLAFRSIAPGRVLVWTTGQGSIPSLIATLLTEQLISSVRLGEASLQDEYFDALPLPTAGEPA